MDKRWIRPIALGAGEAPIAWTSDGRSLLFIALAKCPHGHRLDLATSRKQLWKQLVPQTCRRHRYCSVLITPDGNNYVYEYGRTLSDLYLVNDLSNRTPAGFTACWSPWRWSAFSRA